MNWNKFNFPKPVWFIIDTILISILLSLAGIYLSLLSLHPFGDFPFILKLLAGLTCIMHFPFSVPASIVLVSSIYISRNWKTKMQKYLLFFLIIFTILIGSLWFPDSITCWPIVTFGKIDDIVFINRLFPIHIINPQWLKTLYPADFSVCWRVAELFARFILLMAVLTAELIIFSIIKTRRAERRTNPLQ